MTTSIKRFLGDKERDFRLTKNVIVELERVTGQGIGALCKKLFDGNFHLADIRETIRLGLIGADINPQEAASLVAAYVDGQPLAQTYPIAVDVLSACWFGTADANSEAAPEGDFANA